LTSKNSVFYHTVSIDTLFVYIVALKATVSLLWGTIIFIVALPRNPNMSGWCNGVQFTKTLEDVPTVQLFSARELVKQLTAIRETIADPYMAWSKRVDALKKVRSLLITGASSFDQLNFHLWLLEPPFQTCQISQVVREACYTIASVQLGHRCDHFTECLLNSLINLIQNSAKVIADADPEARLCARKAYWRFRSHFPEQAVC
jgi:hypothetical protein